MPSPQIDINNPGLPGGIITNININEIPSIRDIGKKPEEDDEKDKKPKAPCPWCGRIHG